MKWAVLIALCVSGCGLVPASQTLETPQRDASVQSTDPLRPQARPATQAVPDVPQAGANEVSIGTLGRTIASLGNAAEPGLWLKTPLVAAERSARVFYPATDRSVEVTLIPIEGPATAGSRISLAAMQALGASLGDLIEVDVFGF